MLLIHASNNVHRTQRIQNLNIKKSNVSHKMSKVLGVKNKNMRYIKNKNMRYIKNKNMRYIKNTNMKYIYSSPLPISISTYAIYKYSKQPVKSKKLNSSLIKNDNLQNAVRLNNSSLIKNDNLQNAVRLNNSSLIKNDNLQNIVELNNSSLTKNDNLQNDSQLSDDYEVKQFLEEEDKMLKENMKQIENRYQQQVQEYFEKLEEQQTQLQLLLELQRKGERSESELSELQMEIYKKGPSDCDHLLPDTQRREAIHFLYLGRKIRIKKKYMTLQPHKQKQLQLLLDKQQKEKKQQEQQRQQDAEESSQQKLQYFLASITKQHNPE